MQFPKHLIVNIAMIVSPVRFGGLKNPPIKYCTDPNKTSCMIIQVVKNI